jgi:lambda family phage tail tape measure protein
MASSIRVSLEVDNKKYLSDIKAAEKATDSFATKTNTNTTALVGSFNKLSASTAGLVSKLDGIKSVLAGLITAEALRNANEYANAVKDIAITADVSIGSVIGLGKAFETNGGNAEGARNGILKFSEAIGNAVAGNDAAQKSFADIGISLKDIQQLSQEDLLKKSIEGISNLESAAMRIRVQTDLFGKAAKGVSFKGVQEEFSAAAAGSAKYQSAISAGSDASENLNKQLGALKQALLNVAEPLNKIVAASNTTVSAFESLIKMALGAASAWFIFAKAIPFVNGAVAAAGAGVAAAGGIFAALATQVGAIGRAFLNFGNNILRAFGFLPTAFGGVASLTFAVGALVKGFLRFLGVVGIIYTVAEAIDYLSKKILDFSPIDYLVDKFDKLLGKAKEFFGLGASSDAGAGRGGNADTMKAQLAYGEEMKKQWDEQTAKAAEFKKRQAEVRQEIEKTGDAFKRGQVLQLQRLELEKLMVGKSEDEREKVMALKDMYDKTEETIQGLIDKKKEWLRGTEEQKKNVGIIDEEIARIKALETAHATQLVKYIDGVQGARLIEKARLADIENLTKAMEENAKRQQALTDAGSSITAQLQDAQFQGTQQGKSPFQQQAAEIVNNAKKAALEAGRAYAAAFEDTGDGMTPEKAAEFAAGLKKIEDGYAGISAAQMKNLEASREWNAGWKEAFAKYKDDASNAALESKTYFDTFTSGFEDAIVKFVQTGKLSFKDLANSMIAEFTKIQAKKLLVGLFEGGSTGAGMLGGIGKLLGFASGGNPAIGKPMLVGENGPELMIPRNASTIVPNNALGGSNITQVTYNIQAADAASFRQMLARDPEFLYAVTEKGRSAIPGGRR